MGIILSTKHTYWWISDSTPSSNVSLKKERLLENDKLSKKTAYFAKGASLVADTAKNVPAMWGTQVQTLGWEDPLEKGMATLSSILVWRIPWTELQSIRLQRVGHNWATNTFPFTLFCKEEKLINWV